MMPGDHHEFWVTNHVANPVLRRLLRSSVGRHLGRHLAVLRYRGRRTGQLHELVVQYTLDGQRVWIRPGRPERKAWWRNLCDPTQVELWLAGDHVQGRAVALTGSDHPREVADGLRVYLDAFPHAGKGLGLRSGKAAADADLVHIAPAAVMVRVDLAPNSRSDAQRSS